ncbi:unnamed protein product [Acanthosepion pharaonis]|uniref:Transposase n=1 Tax=Acanthosepion pharaonis TaxID=158019 RepID=A0A812EY42_ACAPH|nr:unnamed protein product [Sepia pharaonis]
MLRDITRSPYVFTDVPFAACNFKLQFLQPHLFQHCLGYSVVAEQRDHFSQKLGRFAVSERDISKKIFDLSLLKTSRSLQNSLPEHLIRLFGRETGKNIRYLSSYFRGKLLYHECEFRLLGRYMSGLKNRIELDEPSLCICFGGIWAQSRGSIFFLHREEACGSDGLAHEFVAAVKETVDNDGSQRDAKIAADMGCHKSTICRTIKKDIGYSSYCKSHCMLITNASKESRKVKAAALLNKLKHVSAEMLRFFSDEKNFIQDRRSNRQNDKWICKDIEEVTVVKHTKFPSSVMVLGVIPSEGRGASCLRSSFKRA